MTIKILQLLFFIGIFFFIVMQFLTIKQKRHIHQKVKLVAIITVAMAVIMLLIRLFLTYFL